MKYATITIDQWWPVLSSVLWDTSSMAILSVIEKCFVCYVKGRYGRCNDVFFKYVTKMCFIRIPISL